MASFTHDLGERVDPLLPCQRQPNSAGVVNEALTEVSRRVYANSIQLRNWTDGPFILDHLRANPFIDSEGLIVSRCH